MQQVHSPPGADRWSAATAAILCAGAESVLFHGSYAEAPHPLSAEHAARRLGPALW